MTEAMIGLEIHVQLKTATKLFCPCSSDYLSARPNENVCPTCTAQPGAKPWGTNKKAFESAAKIALALGCKMADISVVQRKHYFYPDLPANYQRTSTPIGSGGELEGVGITEVHIEEDPGRYELRKGTVDYNRAGVPLLEIVTAPEFTSPEHARSFLKKLKALLGYLEVSRDEPGSTRIDANISLSGGARVEVKNINSFTGVHKALKYEIVRQKALLSRGLPVKSETRHFDEAQKITIGLREKESAADYRYMPDPDILTLVLVSGEVARLKSELPEGPEQRAERLAGKYGIRKREALIISQERHFADLFEEVAPSVGGGVAAEWFVKELRRALKWNSVKVCDIGLKSSHIVELLDMVSKGEITRLGAHRLLDELIIKPQSPRELSKMREAGRLTSPKEMAGFVSSVLGENEKAVSDYGKGRVEALHFLMGCVMEKSGWRADPEVARKALLEKLEKVSA